MKLRETGLQFVSVAMCAQMGLLYFDLFLLEITCKLLIFLFVCLLGKIRPILNPLLPKDQHQKLKKTNPGVLERGNETHCAEITQVWV